MNRLLSINNYYYRRGGAEVVFLEQNRLLNEAGWDITPFAMHHAKNDATVWSKYFVDEIEFGSDYSLLDKLVRVPKVIYSREAQRKVQAVIHASRPSIAHAHNVYHHISPSIFPIIKANGIPVVLTLHDLKLACPAYKMLSGSEVCERCKDGHISHVVKQKCVKGSLALSSVVWLESTVHRALDVYRNNIDAFVVPSRFYIEKMVEWGWDRERFVYIPNFVDVDAFECKQSVGSGYVFFGRLAPEKGVATLIRAAAISRERVTIVGTGPDEADLKSLATSLGADVNFVGYKTGDALFQLIREARAMVLPSEWYENAPMSVMESYALGTPVIGANIGGIPELIKPSMTGALFESGNAVDLANALISFSNMTDESVMSMGIAGRQWVEREFTGTLYRDRLITLYDSLISKQ